MRPADFDSAIKAKLSVTIPATSLATLIEVVVIICGKEKEEIGDEDLFVLNLALEVSMNAAAVNTHSHVAGD